MSESVPTSVTGFAHRRSRADSTASFTYYEDDRYSEGSAEEALLDEEEEDGHLNGLAEQGEDLELGRRPSRRRKSSSYSRHSAGAPLLRRQTSSGSVDTEGYARDGRFSQKIYILTEDLTIVVAGFRTSVIGFGIYLFLCIITAGLGYLLFRWLPRWRTRLTGSPTALGEADWVAIENSWGSLPHKS